MWQKEARGYRVRYFRIEKAYNFPQTVKMPHPPVMIGGGGSKLLKIAGQHADISNLTAPITTGAVDFAAMLKFDKAELKRRIGVLREVARAAGPGPDAIQLCGVGPAPPAAAHSQ